MESNIPSCPEVPETVEVMTVSYTNVMRDFVRINSDIFPGFALMFLGSVLP